VNRQETTAVKMAATGPLAEMEDSKDHTTAVAFDCIVTGSNQVGDWAVGKRAWCCEHAQQGCRSSYSDAASVGDVATTTNPATTKTFDCMNDYQNWRWSWTDTKRTWCCEHKGLGCKNDGVDTSAKAGVYHDCRASPTNVRSEWSDEKQNWCCKHQGVACSAVNPAARTGGHVVHNAKQGTAQKFDCLMDLADFRTKWAEDKKVWCCEHRNVACSVKYHKGHRVWFSRRFEAHGTQSLSMQNMGSSVQVLTGVAAACMLAVGSVLGIRRRNALRAHWHLAYDNFPSSGSDFFEANSWDSA